MTGRNRLSKEARLQNWTVGLWIIGAGVIVGLAIYAGRLLWKVRQQQVRHRLFLEKAEESKKAQLAARNINILESVNVIALAGRQQQCDLSEVAIRLYKLMEVLQGDKNIDFSQHYPALFELYSVVKDMPRGEARQQQSKPARMQNNLIRLKTESRLQSNIEQELDAIVAFAA